MTPMSFDYRVAMGAAHDAGNRSARAAGRDAWSVEDWNAACDTFATIAGELNAPEPSEPRP